MGKRVLRISDSLLLEMLKDGYEAHYRVENGLPADVRIVGFEMRGHWAEGRGHAALLLESAQWEPVLPGQPYPDIDPVITSLYPAKGEFLTFADHRVIA